MGYIVIGLIKLFGFIPFQQAQKFGQWLGKQAYKRPTNMRRIAQINIGLCFPELSAVEQDKLVQAALVETAKSGAEMGVMWGAGPDKGRNLVRKVH
ncbi:MAG: hypothetical protein WAO12_00725, partial [Venatoribacter sp.]